MMETLHYDLRNSNIQVKYVTMQLCGSPAKHGKTNTTMCTKIIHYRPVRHDIRSVLPLRKHFVLLGKYIISQICKHYRFRNMIAVMINSSLSESSSVKALTQG